MRPRCVSGICPYQVKAPVCNSLFSYHFHLLAGQGYLRGKAEDRRRGYRCFIGDRSWLFYLEACSLLVYFFPLSCFFTVSIAQWGVFAIFWFISSHRLPGFLDFQLSVGLFHCVSSLAIVTCCGSSLWAVFTTDEGADDVERRRRWLYSLKVKFPWFLILFYPWINQSFYCFCLHSAFFESAPTQASKRTRFYLQVSEDDEEDMERDR